MLPVPVTRVKNDKKSQTRDVGVLSPPFSRHLLLDYYQTLGNRTVGVSRVIGGDYYKGLARVTVGVAR